MDKFSRTSASQRTAPFFEEIRRYAKDPLKPFHTPGHKAGRNWEQEWLNSKRLARLDLTEITALDWQGALARSEALAAEFYGADQSFFLVQGASQGILGLLIGAFNPGDQVLVARNCHIAVINAMILADLVPVYLEAPLIEEWGIPGTVPESVLARNLALFPDCKGVILTHPTYQGVLGPLAGIRKIIGERLLIIDEAHGGYFGWSGLEGYDAYLFADAWVQGTHKMLGSMTQTAILHLRSGRIDEGRIKRSLELITTTSPSYILLASLDCNRRFLATTGRMLFRTRTPAMLKLKKEIARLGVLLVLDEGRLPDPAGKIDPWKLCLSFKKLGFSGYQAEQILRTEFGIQVEYADLNQVTLFMAPWQDSKDLRTLQKALRAICRRSGSEPADTILPANIPPLKLHPREAALGKGSYIGISEAVGRVSADLIAPYPPGIPLIAPGELIRQQEIVLIKRVLKNGGTVRGVSPRGEIRVANCG